MQASYLQPYAQALFELVKKDKQLTEVTKHFLANAKALEQNPHYLDLIYYPLYSEQLKSSVLIQILKIEHPLLSNFIKVLARAKRLIFLPFIGDIFNKYWREFNEIKKFKVTTAFALTKSQQQSLEAKLIKSKQRIEVVYQINREIMAGLIVEDENQVMDYSLQNSLERLCTYLQK